MGSQGSTAWFPDDVRITLDTFRRIVQLLRSSARESELKVGLSSAQLFALQQLASSPGMSVNELASRTFTHQSSVSVVVSRLVERRLVAKITSPEDRRRVRLALTEAGHAVLRRSPEPVQHRLLAGIAALPDQQLHALAQALTEIARAIAPPVAHPPMLLEDDLPRKTKRRRSTRRAPGARRTGRRRR